jgi:thymidylate kinase
MVCDCMFVVYEGMELSSKSTQIRESKKLLSTKYDTVAIKSPIASHISRIAHDYNEEHVSMSVHPRMTSFFLYTSVLLETTPQLKEIIAHHDITLSDRYFWTTLAEGNAFTGKNLDCIYDCLLETGLIAYPDLSIFLDVPFKVRKKRAETRDVVDNFDKFSISNEEFNSTLRREYIRLSKKYPNWEIVDGNRDIPDITEDIIALIERYST